MKVLSLFDGMACGMLAMQGAGIKVDRYVAFEIDKYAVQTSSHNFPMIEHRGDVFKADFTEFSGFDFLVGGSPCTYWSIAQKNNRETEASGMGWELFSQYVRALREAHPMYFIYENNKSMSKAIRESIAETFGFDAVEINSSLVSAQNRQRLYWVGKRNLNGTYSRVKVEQPLDRGILLKDVLDRTGAKELTEREMDYMVRQTSGVRNHFDFGYIQDATRDKGACVTANISKGVPYNVCCEPVVLTDREKSRCVLSSIGRTTTREYFQKDQGTMAYEPVAVRCRGRKDKDGNGYAKYECREDGKANTLDTNTVNGAMCAEPVRIPEYGIDGKARPVTACYAYKGSGEGSLVSEAFPDNPNKQVRDYVAEPLPVFATACEWDENGKPSKAVSGTDGKAYTVYEVKDGQITIKGKQYPIKLVDGYYIIRKLTVSECKRLQTVPEWYEFPVSDTQAYKMLGNGWTVEVIIHLINATQTGELGEEQLDLFKMLGVN